MKGITFFTDNNSFEKEFQRCCKQYHELDIYVAWIGNPQAVIPFYWTHNPSC